MNVFADEHHDSLYQFLRILFERRLKGSIYRPIGYEWYENRIWQYSHLPGTIAQYLQIPNSAEFRGDVYHIPENRHIEMDKCITFEQFHKMKIDLVVATVSNHEVSFSDLAKSHWNKPKFIRVIGNINEPIDFSYSRNIIATATTIPIPPDINVVFCHQEFDLGRFCYKPPAVRNSIKNMMNCFPSSRDFALWGQYKALLPEFEWKMHGILGEDGIIGPADDMAAAMHDSTFIWHVKPGGDGFGHNVHNAYAVGRPLITRRKYYAGKLGGQLMTDNETCIDLDAGTPEENAERIRLWARPENHDEMCKRAYQRFKEVVDYDREFGEIQKFLSRLQ